MTLHPYLAREWPEVIKLGELTLPVAKTEKSHFLGNGDPRSRERDSTLWFWITGPLVLRGK